MSTKLSSHELQHDALHCPHCSHLQRLQQAVEILTGIQQATLSKLDGEYGVPHGTIFQFSQKTPGMNTVYNSAPAPFDGVIKSMVITGSGNITVTLSGPNIPGGGMTIGTFACNSVINLPLRFACPVNSIIGLSTDASSVGLVSFSAWLEPSRMDASEFFRMRR